MNTMDVVFRFTDEQISNLKIVLKNRATDEQKNKLIKMTEQNIKNMLLSGYQIKPLRAADTKDRLKEIEDAALHLLKLMDRQPKDVARNFNSLLFEDMNPSWFEDMKYQVFELAHKTGLAAEHIEPGTNNKPAKAQLRVLLEESYKLAFRRSPGKGKGTSFYLFQEQVFSILKEIHPILLK